MSAQFDSKFALIDALRGNSEKFELSNIILPKASGLKAVKMLYGLQNDLRKFAYNPETKPMLMNMPQPPVIEGMSEIEARQQISDFNELKEHWLAAKEAHQLKISESDYFHVEAYLNQYFMTLAATSAIKGNRFYSLTKNVERAEKGGILGNLFNRGKKTED